MKYLTFLLLLITCVGCSDDEIEPTKDTEALIDTPKTVEESVSKTDEEVVTEIPETDTPSIDLSAALRGKVLRFILAERGRSYLAWLEFHANGTLYMGTDLNGNPALKWDATGNQVAIHSEDDQNEAWFVFSDPTLSVGSNIILDLPSADAPESKGKKVTILSVTDIPPAVPLDSPLPFTLSRETTHITTPLRDDGYPDYVAAINGIMSRDVTPENNAFIPLYELIYRPGFAPGVPGDPAHDWFFQELGVKPFPEERLRFRYYQWYLNQLIGRKEKLQLSKPGSFYKPYDLPAQHQTTYWRFHEMLEKQIEVALRRPWKQSEFYFMSGWLDYNKQVLERFRKATQRTRYYSPLLNNSEGTLGLFGTDVMGTNELRAVAKAALVRATLNLGEGRIEEAIQDALACHRLGRLISQSHGTYFHLTSLTLDSGACQADMLIAHHGKLTLEQLTNWRQELQRLPPLFKMVDKLDTTGRYDFLDGALSVAQYGPKAFEVYDRDTFVSLSSSKEWLKVPFNRNLLAQLNRVIDWDDVLREGNRRYDSLVAAGHRKPCQERMKASNKWVQTFIPTSTKRKEMGLTNLQKAQDDGPLQKAFTKSIIDYLTSIHLEYMGRRIDDDDIALMRNYLVGLSLSLAHYRLENGGYPENLSQLSPRYIGKVPDDFFVGQPLRYERKETGYLLYSQGPNRKDDLGLTAGYRGDIVFQVPLPALDED
jgi:hypothetical protein